MQIEDVDFIDNIVREYRRQLLAIPYLKRATKAQRQALAAAHSLVLSLPALVRERYMAQVRLENQAAMRREAAETALICDEIEARARGERT